MRNASLMPHHIDEGQSAQYSHDYIYDNKILHKIHLRFKRRNAYDKDENAACGSDGKCRYAYRAG